MLEPTAPRKARPEMPECSHARPPCRSAQECAERLLLEPPRRSRPLIPPFVPLTDSNSMAMDNGKPRYETILYGHSGLAYALCSYLGVTPPISTNESTQREKEVTQTLMEELRRQNTFESEEEAKTRCVTHPDSMCLRVLCPCYVHTTTRSSLPYNHLPHLYGLRSHNKYREIVLGRVAALVRTFVKKVSIMRGFTEAAAEAAGGKIFTFGSYRLGVHGPGSDIDTLCVVPKHVTRDDFFETFELMLREMDGVAEVSVRMPFAFAGTFADTMS